MSSTSPEVFPYISIPDHINDFFITGNRTINIFKFNQNREQIPETPEIIENTPLTFYFSRTTLSTKNY